MSVNRISSTERSSFQESPHETGPDRRSYSTRLARLEEGGNKDASSASGDDSAEHRRGEAKASHVSGFCEATEPTLRREESLEDLLERLKNARRLDLRL